MSAAIAEAADDYKRRCPGKHRIAQEVRRCLAEKIEQFPEACCPDASHLLCACSPDFQIVCGQFKNRKMKRRAFHVWVFDTKERVHIDLTADQFPTAFGRDVAVMPKTPGFMTKLGYAMADVDTLGELYAGPFKHFGDLNKSRISDTESLSDVVKCSKTLVKAVERK